MANIKYSTGRNYGATQVLDITFLPSDDDWADVSVSFTDTARGISGVVQLMGLETTPRDVGAAVLREYDAGRYQLAI